MEHGGLHAVKAEGVHDDQVTHDQGRQEAGVADANVQAKESDDDDHDDTNDTVIVGPAVPRDEGGEDDPVQ